MDPGCSNYPQLCKREMQVDTMTKNEDVSWIPKSVGCSLKRFTTAELVKELSKRDGVEFYDTLQKNQELRIETVYYRNRFKFDTNCKILVVRE